MKKYGTVLLVSLLTSTISSFAAETAKLTTPGEFNNAGVSALKAGNSSLAIEDFKATLKIQPNYRYAADNLAIAYNNLALKAPLKEAISLFHQALLLDPNNKTTKENLDREIKILKKDPNKFDDRVAFAEECLKNEDNVGAIAEFSQALAIKNDSAIKERLQKISRSGWLLEVATKLPGSLVYDSSIIVPVTANSLKKQNANIEDGFDFNPYMRQLQKQIKKHWFPPAGTESKSTAVLFKVSKDGRLSDLQINKSSGIPLVDKAALDAVVDTAPFAPLPEGSKQQVDIRFTFDYNVHNAAIQKPHNFYNESLSKKYLDEAKLLTSTGKHTQAIKKLEKAYDISASDKQIKVLLAQEYSTQLDPALSNEDKLQLSCKILSLDEKNQKAELALKQCATDMNKSISSPGDLLALSDKVGNSEAALYLMNRALLLAQDAQMQKQIRESITHVYAKQQAKELKDRWERILYVRKSADGYTGLGNAYELGGDNEKALEMYDEALKLDPSFEMAKRLHDSLQERLKSNKVSSNN